MRWRLDPKAKAYYRRACAYEGTQAMVQGMFGLEKRHAVLHPRDKSIKESNTNQLKQKTVARLRIVSDIYFWNNDETVLSVTMMFHANVNQCRLPK